METNDFRYWAILDGMRVGPMSIEELVEKGINEDTPVWRTGLTDWCKASEVPELANALETVIPPVPTCPPDYTRGYTQGYTNGYTNTWQSSPYDTANNQRTEEPMPPTYLVWSVLSMILCCLPTGIAAVVYSSKVNSLYTSGDYIGAKKASENAAIWIIITWVLGLIALPFQMILAFL